MWARFRARATEQTLSTEAPGETEAKQLAGAVLLRQALLRYQDEITPRKRGAGAGLIASSP